MKLVRELFLRYEGLKIFNKQRRGKVYDEAVTSDTTEYRTFVRNLKGLISDILNYTVFYSSRSFLLEGLPTKLNGIKKRAFA